MKTPQTTKILMAVLATGILAVGAIAVGVEAKPGDGQGGPGPSGHDQADRDQAKADRQQDRQNASEARKALKEDRKELRDDVKEACKAAGANSTLAKRCDHLKDAVKARRVAHALLTAIRVHERELGRITFRIYEAQLALQNSTLNATEKAHLQDHLAKLQDRQQHVIEKIAEEKAKLQTLHDKWSEVADHLRDRKEKGEDDGGVDDESGDAGDDTETATSTSAAA
jgi:DNA gyrase/topoisomerase IV subunit A